MTMFIPNVAFSLGSHINSISLRVTTEPDNFNYMLTYKEHCVSFKTAEIIHIHIFPCKNDVLALCLHLSTTP